MRLISSLLVSLIFTLASVQAQDTQKAEAYIFDSFGHTPNGDTKGRQDALFTKLSDLPGSRGVIVVYGDRPYVSSRPRFYKNQVLFRS